MLANCPIEKQQSLATNQAGQINTHSMQPGPRGDSEAPVLVPLLGSLAEHRLMQHGRPMFIIMMSPDMNKTTLTESITNIKMILTPECERQPKQTRHVSIHNTKPTKKPKGVFSVLLVLI